MNELFKVLILWIRRFLPKRSGEKAERPAIKVSVENITFNSDGSVRSKIKV
jgi:hypothetical protein